MVFVVILVLAKAVVAELLVQLDGSVIILANFQTHINAAGCAGGCFGHFNQLAPWTAATHGAVYGDRVEPRQASTTMQNNQHIAGQNAVHQRYLEGTVFTVDPATKAAATKAVDLEGAFFQRL